MALCENCNREIIEEPTYVYTMESPTDAVETLELCPACASEVIHALYDDVPGEVL